MSVQKIVSPLRLLVFATTLLFAGCGFVGSDDATGWPEIDLGVPVEVYKVTNERDLHVHLFMPEEATAQPRGAALFFHGGGFRQTRVPQFERQAQMLADVDIAGIVVEYRVASEGTTRADAVADGADALAWVIAQSNELGIDPGRVAIAGSSAGGTLAVEASEGSAAVVLFNPAVGGRSAGLVADAPTIVFHSREDTIVPFSSAEAFCSLAVSCELVAFDQGDHGFFNDDPAFTETTRSMIEFLETRGW